MFLVMSGPVGHPAVLGLSDDAAGNRPDRDGGPASAADGVPRPAATGSRPVPLTPDDVARLERGYPRWVWDDTAVRYPPLLAAGTRVERCWDLRLSHAILRASARCADTDLARREAGPWDRPLAAPAPPVTQAAVQETLFDDEGTVEPEEATPSDAGSHASREGDVTGREEKSNAREGDVTTGTGDPAPRDRDATSGEAGAAAREEASAGEGGATGQEGNATTRGQGSSPGPDPLAEFADQRAALGAVRDGGGLNLLLAAVGAGALIAAEMHHAGLPWDAAEHDRVLTALLGARPPLGGRPERLAALAADVSRALDGARVNPDSQPDLLRALRRAGLSVETTRSWELREIDHPVIAPLLAYKKLARLASANGWHWLETWAAGGRFRPEYVVDGVVTGRWATSGGGALQLPKEIRSAAVADPGWRLVVADAAQLEPRVLAGLARDTDMARAGAGGDLYEGIVRTGAVATRQHAKIGMLGALYGGTTGVSGVVLPRMRRVFPRSMDLVERAARTGERGGIVTTRLGRSSPPPPEEWHAAQRRALEVQAGAREEARARSQARAWGRFTRNFVVQGTAAEWALCWMAAIRRDLAALPPAARAGLAPAPFDRAAHLVFFLHDEVIVHAPAEQAEAVADIVHAAAAEAGRLLFGDFPVDFPLSVAVVENYGQAG